MNRLKPSHLMNLFFHLRLLDALHRVANRNRLTVLAYHRIDNPHASVSDTFTPNVSATPAQFAAQMAYLSRRYTVVSIDDVTAWLRGEHSLPPYPALITFDDGYADNFRHALPVLKKFGFPAVVFLATDYIGKSEPFFWDLAAYCFAHTQKTSVTLPPAGELHWGDADSRTAAMVGWLERLKALPNAAKKAHIRALPDRLDVAIPADAFAGLTMTWNEVRTMIAHGVAMGAHTMSHPVLTRVSLTQAQAEISGSQACIEAMTGQPVTTFAYPNGHPADFNTEIQRHLKETGIETAFTLLPGPIPLAEVRRTPLTIGRMFLSHKDSPPRFAAKLVGLPRILGFPR